MESSVVELREHVEVDGHAVLATLHPHGLLQWEGEMLRGRLILQDDLLGFTKGSPATITLHAFKMGSASWLCRSSPKRTRKDIVFTITTGGDSYRLWCEALQRHLDSQERPKRLVFFINPAGGTRRAKDIFVKEVQPLLGVAGLSYTVKETQYQLHAKELAKTMDLSAFDGVICVSGDGLLVEVLNGLLERPDWEKAIKMPIGAIPAGSGNGIATSLLSSGSEPCDAAHAAFAIIRGHKQPLDVATFSQGQARFHSIFGLLWGLTADVDIESEMIRCLGKIRFDIYSLIRIISLRLYNANLAYIPAPGYEAFGAALSADVEEALLSNDVITQVDSERGYAGPEIATRNSEWQTIQGPFTLVWMQNVSHATVGMIPTPLAKFADGYLDLMIIRECPRWKMLMLFLKLADGSHIQSEYVQYLKVRAFRLAPGGIVGSKGKGGIISVDGEVIARGKGAYGSNHNDIMSYGPPIDISIAEGFATLFCPPSESQNNDTFSPV